MTDLFILFFRLTAWPMETPHPGSPFHLLLAAGGSLAAISAALFLGGRPQFHPEKVLFSCGLILAAAEIYKQGFLYFLVNGCRYNWWYFPFQLCSIPMYLCLLYPALCRCRKHGRGGIHAPAARIAASFLQDFGLLGGIMALAFPEGFLYPYVTLTLHGFVWHFLLLFIGFYCGRRRLSDLSSTGFARCLPLYLFCCLIAAGINTAVQLTVYPAGYADLFYINCFFPSGQPVFSQISLALGNLWGHGAYLLSSCLGAGLIHRFCARIFRAVPFSKALQNRPKIW